MVTGPVPPGRRVLLRQPRWLLEGLATWAETIGTTASGLRMVTGPVPRGRRVLARPQRIPARALLAWDGSTPPEGIGAYYDAAWLLVHYLVNEHPAELRAYESRLADAVDPDQAFRGVFPQWDPATSGGPERLDVELDAWAMYGRFDPRPVHVETTSTFTVQGIPRPRSTRRGSSSGPEGRRARRTTGPAPRSSTRRSPRTRATRCSSGCSRSGTGGIRSRSRGSP
jgi:hypothetical protein